MDFYVRTTIIRVYYRVRAHKCQCILCEDHEKFYFFLTIKKRV